MIRESLIKPSRSRPTTMAPLYGLTTPTVKNKVILSILKLVYPLKDYYNCVGQSSIKNLVHKDKDIQTCLADLITEINYQNPKANGSLTDNYIQGIHGFVCTHSPYH